VQEGKIPATVARELSKMPAEEQPKALTKLIEQGHVKGEGAKQAARQVASGKEPPAEPGVKMLGRRYLQKLRDDLVEFQGAQCQVAAATIDFVLGNPRAFRDFDTLRETIKSIKAEINKPKSRVKKAKKDE
jgi:hypothetical protein